MKIKKYIMYMIISVLVFHCTNINARAAEVVMTAPEQINKTEEVSNTNVATTEEVKAAEVAKEVEEVNEAEALNEAEEVNEAEALNEDEEVNEDEALKEVEADNEADAVSEVEVVKDVKAVKKDKVVKTVKADKQVKEAVKKYNAAELRLLSAIIYCEANSEKYNGKLAVGIVVMNRVRSSLFPDTVKEVIYQKSQFSPARSGSLKKALEEYDNDEFTSDMEKECIKAAKEALSGVTSITVKDKNKNFSKFLFFSGSIKGYTYQIGNHQFK